MTALLLLLATLFQPIVAPCPTGVSAYPVVESYEDGSIDVGAFCATGSEGPSLSFVFDPDTRAWSLDLRTTDR